MSLWTDFRDRVLRPVGAALLEKHVPGGGLIADVTGIKKRKKGRKLMDVAASNEQDVLSIVESVKSSLSPKAQKIIDTAITAEKALRTQSGEAAQQAVGPGVKFDPKTEQFTPTKQKQGKRTKPKTDTDPRQAQGSPTKGKSKGAKR